MRERERERVEMLTTRRRFDLTNENEVSVMTWNVLNQRGALRHNKTYHNNENPYLNTFNRRKKRT